MCSVCAGKRGSRFSSIQDFHDHVVDEHASLLLEGLVQSTVDVVYTSIQSSSDAQNAVVQQMAAAFLRDRSRWVRDGC